MFIDVHSHLDICDNTDKIIKESKKNNLIILTDGISIETNRKTLELSEKYDNVRACLGIYPIEALELKDGEIDEEIDFIRENKKKITAIGEVGMDFKEDLEKHNRQKEIFEKFIDLAIELDKPIVVHSRKAEKECIEILEKKKIKKVVMHCFNGNFNLVKRIIENGWFLTIPTNVTFSEHFQKIIGEVPIENLLCETDSPYLHPKKERNNNPNNVIESYKKIAEIKKISLKDTEKIIEENYNKLFS